MAEEEPWGWVFGSNVVSSSFSLYSLLSRCHDVSCPITMGHILWSHKQNKFSFFVFSGILITEYKVSLTQSTHQSEVWDDSKLSTSSF